ncbi:RNA-directed DNA polymerase [bacterium]|nr:RNA-directed DNA polymerase [bacterium]
MYGEFPAYLKKVVKKIVYDEPTKKGIFKGKKSDYNGLPRTKSLFFTKENCGLPIGNLTSQLFSNIYLNDFDHFVKEELGIKYYGRYVDDFVLIHREKEVLKNLIPQMRNYLQQQLHLTLHPKKIYLQPVQHGVQFL